MSTSITEERDLDVAGITTAEVAAFNGDVVVETGAEKPRLLVTLTGRASYKVERLGSLLYVTGKIRGLTYLGSAVSFQLWLPPGLALKLATVSGTIRVQGAVRTLDAKTATGAIEADGTGQGGVQARTANGPISLRGAGGRIRAGSANGEIAIAQATGQIHAATSKGAIRIMDAAGQVQAATSNGPIRLERVMLAPGSKSWARTGNGLVEVHGLSAPGGLRIRARVGRAPIQANLPGYEVRLDPYHLRAHLAGPHPGELELATGGQVVITA